MTNIFGCGSVRFKLKFVEYIFLSNNFIPLFYSSLLFLFKDNISFFFLLLNFGFCPTNSADFIKDLRKGLYSFRKLFSSLK